MSGYHAENIPKEMRDLPQWVCFRKYAENPGDHPKKMMISPETGEAARSDDPSTWSNFFIASSLMARKRMDGLAFALTRGIVFIDLDNAVLEGGVSNAAREILHALPKTYAETSCSGKGIHVFCKGTLDEASLKRNDKLGIEMYQSKRFACMEHIQIKKPIKIAIICLAALIAAGAVAGASYWAGLKNGAQAQTCQTCPATISESGVAVKCAYKANSADAYGSYEITYTVTPAIYTDEIAVKLAYSDGSEVPSTVATLDHAIMG